MITLNSGIPTSTERNYNLEFCEELTSLIIGRAGEPLRLPDLLAVAKKVAGEELWLVEEAIWEFAKIPEVQLSEEEKEHLKQKLADLKEKHTAKVLTTIERVASAFNPSADESRIQTVISNAIKTSNLSEPNPHIEVVRQPKTPEEHKASNEPNMETLKQYLNLGIKLIPVYDDNRFVKDYNNPNSKTKDWGTDDITEIQSLINGNGYRDGLGKGSKIKLFRFYPSDYELVVIDIDRHRTKDGKLEKNGSKNWLKIEAELNLPQNCKIMTHACCVHTPSEGFHLYYRTEGKVEFQKELTTAVDIPKTVNVAGSVKAGREYLLEGSLYTIPSLPDELKKRMLKPPKAKPQTIRTVSIPQDFSNGSKDLTSEEREAYKPFLRDYLIAKGFKINNRGLTNCPFTEHHKDGDNDPSAQVNQIFLYCYTSDEKYHI